MKISTTQYAQVLLDLTKDKDEKKIDKIVSDFITVLRNRNQINLVNKVIQKFSSIYNQTNKILDVEVVSMNPLDAEQKEGLNNFLKRKYQFEQITLTERIDKGIKGGLIIKVGDEVFDGSINGKLKRMKGELVG